MSFASHKCSINHKTIADEGHGQSRDQPFAINGSTWIQIGAKPPYLRVGLSEELRMLMSQPRGLR